MSILKSSFCTERLRLRLDILRLRFSIDKLEPLLALVGESFKEALRFKLNLFVDILQKHGNCFCLSGSGIMQSRQVAIVSDSGDVNAFFCK